MGEPRRSFFELRGGTPDERPTNGKLYSPASYAAQYGIPLEDAVEIVERAENHGEAVAEITQGYLSHPEFRDRAIVLDVRPLRRGEAAY